ncbi:MAG TPA: family 78 glycoside hydrolase catalytic domain [Candidatus Methylacidiphilales bacterium]
MSSPFGNARWIASPVRGGVHTVPPAPFFRKAFTLGSPVRKARLLATALGLYEAEINGRRVGDHVFAPGWTDYAKRVAYQTYDVAALLRKGENVLGFVLGDGWYCGTIAWHQERQHYGDRPRLLTRLEIECADGSTTVVASDGTWRTATGPILEGDFLHGETHDARLERRNWSSPGLDEDGWGRADLVPDPGIALDLSDAPPVRRIGEIRPVDVRTFQPNHAEEFRIYDLGQNFSGRARITVRAARGRTVTLRFAEILQPDGRLYTENLRGARATDRYTCRSAERETWEPRFTFHGFRYVEVSGAEPDDEIEIVGVVLHSDTKPTGRFACSNPLLNQLQSNIVWGQKSNFLEVPTDCPQRDERLGWTGDAQVFVRTAAFNMDVQGFFRKWILDIRDAQRPDGAVPCVVPWVKEKTIPQEDGGPAWSDAAIICPWTIYLCYGDRTILEDHYAAMSRYLAHLGKRESKGLIRCHPDLGRWQGFGDWLALDGGGRLEGITPKDLLGTAFYAHDAELMARIARLLGKKEDARRYAGLHEKIVRAFRKRFVTGDGLIVAGTQTAYVLALHFDLLPEKLRPVAAAFLAKDIEQRGFHLATGFVGTPHLLDVLTRFGHLNTAYKLLEQETFPSWLFPVKNGATTIWERWDGWTPEKGPQDKGMNSYNHYAYGAVGAWMYATVAGLDLDPEEPGYRHIVFRPRPGGTLTWAEAELETSRGKAAIRWDETKAGLKLDLLVPKGSRGTLRPPPGFGEERTFGPGRHRLLLKR